MEILKGVDFTLGPLVTTFILGFTVLLLMIWYSSRHQRYWKEIGLIPYLKPLPILGSLHENIIKPMHILEMDRYVKYGRLYGHYEASRPVISVAEPELLRSILVKDFPAFTSRRNFTFGDPIADKMVSAMQGGEDWKRVRTIITPTFTTGKIKRMLSIFKECSRTLVQNFRDAAKAGKPIEAKAIYGAFTMDIIASSAFSTKIDSHNDPNNKFVQTARNVFTRNFSWRFLVLLLAPWFMKLFKLSAFPPEGLRFFSEVTLQIIEERKRTGQRRNDFLQLLMDTEQELVDEGKLDFNEKDDIVENYGKVDSEEFKPESTLTKKNLTRDELVAQCVIFFLAGYDTTASTLSFISYNLALNPDCQEKLIRELDDALREHNGDLTYETIQSMKYLDNVISETLRLYPPAVRLERLAEEDYKLGDTGITIPKDMIVTIPVWAIHRDPKFFPDPEKFEPDRFTPEERAKRDQYAYIPFGAGPRNCVGMRFALMEVKVCIAHVLSNFRIRRCSETQVPLQWYLGQGLLQPRSVKLKLEVREDAVKAL